MSFQKLAHGLIASSCFIALSASPITPRLPSEPSERTVSSSSLKFVRNLPLDTVCPSLISADAMFTINCVQTFQEKTGDEKGEKIFEGTDLTEAIRELAEDFQVKIVMDETIAGKVHCSFIPESFEQSLKQVLTPLGYYYALRNDKYYIGPADPKNKMFPMISTKVDYKPQYRSSEYLIDKLPEAQRIFVHPGEEKYQLLIEAPQSLCDEIVSRIRQADTPIPEIRFDGYFVLAPGNSFYNLRDNPDTDQEHPLSGISGLSKSVLEELAKREGCEDWTSNFEATNRFLRLLASEGHLELKSIPGISTHDGQKGSISISQEESISPPLFGINGIFNQDVQTITECIEVSFTPEIQGNTISMDLNFAYQSEFLETNEKGDEPIANPCPIIQRHSLGTDVKVESGRTLIIGTSIQRKKFSEVNRIDFLADLPLIGSLFQAHEMKEQELDVVIVMSPRLLSETNSEDINRE